MRQRSAAWASVLVLAAIAVIYWPVLHADFVWDDVGMFVNTPYLSQGDHWKQYIFNGFSSWISYFRPLVLLLYTAQVRAFDVTPGPMHAVSLALHLLDTALVGVLALRLRALKLGDGYADPRWIAAGAMVFYGLNPLLVEPVTWIGCQFELLVALFTLAGLHAHLGLRRPVARAAVVATCFFLAACSKEAAISFPLLLIVYDWLVTTRHSTMTFTANVVAVLRRSWPTYAAVVAAGIAYLAFRYWALGHMVPSRTIDNRPLFDRMQEIAFTYAHYWQALLWPMSGTGPIHTIDRDQFATLSALSAARDVAAVCVVVAGFWLAIRRSSLVGLIIVIVTIALFPVLHVLPVLFDHSLYHERYVLLALATATPVATLWNWSALFGKRRAIPLGTCALIAAWVALSVMNIRVTVPLWSNNVALWEWSLKDYPHSIDAKENLMGAYLHSGDMKKANAFGKGLVSEELPSKNSLFNAAYAATMVGDTAGAERALDLLQRFPGLTDNSRNYRAYLTARGWLLIVQKKYAEAVAVLQIATGLDKDDSEATYLLAQALAKNGQTADARRVGDVALKLARPEWRNVRERVIAQAITDGKQP